MLMITIEINRQNSGFACKGYMMNVHDGHALVVSLPAKWCQVHGLYTRIYIPCTRQPPVALRRANTCIIFATFLKILGNNVMGERIFFVLKAQKGYILQAFTERPFDYVGAAGGLLFSRLFFSVDVKAAFVFIHHLKPDFFSQRIEGHFF